MQRPPDFINKMTAKKLTKAHIEEIFAKLSKLSPDPKTELHYTNPFTLLVAVVLSAQATDAGVNKATPKLFEKAQTPEQMVALGEEAIIDHIKTIGLFRSKGKNVFLLSEKLIKEFNSQVPSTLEQLQSLPGVGRKTANVVLNVVYHKPTIAVDTHVFRLSRRLGLSKGTTPEKVEQDLLKCIPKAYLMNAHHWLILHGRYICKAQKPQCSQCPISELCLYGAKNF